MDTLRTIALLCYLLGDGPDTAYPPPSEAGWNVLADFAEANEICTGRDFKDGWNDEVQWIRSRYRDQKELPRLHDLTMLPSAEESRRAADFGIEWYAYNHDDPGLTKEYLEKCRGPWSLLLSAHHNTTALSRRQALFRLREAIGPEAYYAGRMPPPAPFWRFEEAK